MTRDLLIGILSLAAAAVLVVIGRPIGWERARASCSFLRLPCSIRRRSWYFIALGIAELVAWATTVKW